jgi:Glycine/D-amino acid oxidases (deaminating)
MTVNSQEADVLILGGGVIGLCSAWYLLRAGRRVRVLEATRIGAGSSHGNCGTITPSHAPLTAPGTVRTALASLFDRRAPLYVKPTLDIERLAWLLGFARRCSAPQFRHVLETRNRLMLASRALLETLIADAGLDCGFTASGTLYVYRDPDAFEHGCRVSEAIASVGVPVETLNTAALLAREPALKPGVVGGHFHPGDARLRPDRYVAELARAVREAGGEIVEQAPVSGFEQDGQRLTAALTPQGRHRARDIVLALGAWSPRLARPLGLRLPMQPGRVIP